MIPVTEDMIQKALDIFLAAQTETIGQIDQGMHNALVGVFEMVEHRHMVLCGERGPEGVRCRETAGHTDQHAAITKDAVIW